MLILAEIAQYAVATFVLCVGGLAFRYLRLEYPQARSTPQRLDSVLLALQESVCFVAATVIVALGVWRIIPLI